jgi:DNA-binding MarR family transcriptional regulator
MLLRDHGPSSQQALVEALSLDPSNLVALLNELEERGLITRRRDPADRRRHIVGISTEGEERLLGAQLRLVRAEDHILSALSAEERTTLHELLTRAVGTQLSASTCAKDDDPPPEDCPQIA